MPKTTTTVTPDTGHVHVSMDGRLLTLYAGSSYTIPSVPPGSHLIQAEFVEANHTPFNPRVLDAVTITVT
ncbi:MAG: hypothetical protein ABR552_00250 [Actinomycetota bacterium]